MLIIDEFTRGCRWSRNLEPNLSPSRELNSARQVLYKYLYTIQELIRLLLFLLKTTEVTSLRKEVEKHKELVSSADVKVKWQQNKIKAEQDTNKVIGSSYNDNKLLPISQLACPP